ncbi:MAG: penicillin-binding protein 2 [Actinomycetota bacterium]|nr:penicillin-binding protein 2 [Actinomycetota bacterium]
MSLPVRRLFLVVMVLFGALVVFTSRWTVFEAKSLNDNPLNRRQLLEQLQIKRGLITAADGTVLARSVRGRGGVYHRRYPQDELLSHALGYWSISFGRAGLERARNDELAGHGSDLGSIIDQLQGKRRDGDNVETTLSPKAQRTAIDALSGQRGAVVALDPRNGDVKVMASYPQFNPNAVANGGYPRLARQPGAPLLNRTTQGEYPPGSTFKVMTAVAAIDSGRYSIGSMVNGDSPKTISGVPLSNDFGQSFGDIDLTTALTHSVNTVWAQIGESLGKRLMGNYMERFGFYAKPPLDYPADQRYASGEYFNGNLLSPNSSRIDVGRMAIGQDKLLVTPLQMAMVASAVANHGVLVRPHLTKRVVDPDGRVRDDVGASVYHQVMKPETAAKVGEMMANVVKEGTGTQAALQGIDVAGKTGTAEIGNGVNQVWFIAFAPSKNPRIVVAATVERSTGTGGEVAGPIAKQVMEALL